MADFGKEFDLVVKAEGGYVNDPTDRGGETYMGISRKANPSWDGWKRVDALKKQHGSSFKNYLKKDFQLTAAVRKIYKAKYWDVFELDKIPNQNIAHQLFDTAVNMGTTKAIKIMQETLNLKVTGKWSKMLKSKLMKL